MKLWTVQYHQDDSPSGDIVEWFGSKRDAQIRYDDLNSDLEGNGVSNLEEPKVVVVPAGKQALIRFLNSWAANGLSA